MLSNAVQTIWAALPHAQADDAKEIAAGLTGLINGLLSARPDEEARVVVGAAMRAAVQAFIQQHLDDLSLDETTLCRTFACSRARLYRLFRSYGGVLSYIRNLRLERCYDDLGRASPTSGRVLRIATRWGFDNPSHFNRLFKARFGMPPSEVPPLDLDPRGTAPMRFPQNAAIARLHRWFRHP